MTSALKVVTAAMMLLATVPVAAQDSQPAAQNKPPAVSPVSLKVSLVFSRYQGEKKISSVPHTLWVTTGDRTSLRLGTQIPVPTTVLKEGTGAVQSYNYRDVGTNIDCSATPLPDGAYQIRHHHHRLIGVLPGSDRLGGQIEYVGNRCPGVPQFQLDVHHRAQGRTDGTVHLGDRPGQRPGHQARRDNQRSKIVSIGEFRRRIGVRGAEFSSPRPRMHQFTDYCKNVESASTTIVFRPISLSPTITLIR